MSERRTTLQSLFALPELSRLEPGLRELLLQQAGGEDGAIELDAPLPVLADILSALARLDADAEMVAAAVMFAAREWATPLLPAVEQRYPRVHALVDGLQASGQVWVLHAERRDGGNQERLRRLLLAIVRDLRVVPILLAQQLARMRAASAAPEAERLGLARLTRDIHAPLANRLGIWQLKWELEDLAFRQLEPETYRRIAGLLDAKRSVRELFIEQVRQELADALAAQGIRAEIAGRPKHIYSIWKKMQAKDIPFGELYDLRAVRVLVDDVPACYAALGVVHALWVPIPSEFDDYIARPKRNDYRSLHTAVVGPEGKTLEVQIRTFDMHEQAELGVAAHWRYKEGGSGDSALERKIEWMRRLLDAHQDGGGDGALASGFDTELVEDRVYTLTPMGEVIDLPRGSTPLDFAYHVHTMVGHRCRGAKVNGRIVPLDHELASGDRVEILTGKAAEPRRDWLVTANGYLASARAREKVRNWFHRLDRVRNEQDGRELLERELKRVGMQQADPAPALRRFRLGKIEDLYVQVALGDVGPHQVARALLEHEADSSRGSAAEAEATAPRAPRRRAADGAEFSIVGVDNLLVQVARCCRPLPGEQIGGYLTRGRGVSVHRSDCVSYLRLASREPQRALPVEWGKTRGEHLARVVVEGVDRKYLLKDVTNLIAQEDAHLHAISSERLRDSGLVRLRLRLRVQDFGRLSRLLGKMEAIPGVEQAYRV